jgi:hypothetical protein
MKPLHISDIITTPPAQLGTISAHEKALAMRDELVLSAAKLPAINSPETALQGGEVLRELSTYASQVEAARVAAKDPYLQIGRDIDDLAKTLVNEVKTQINRLKPLLGTWSAEQDKKAQEARQKAFEEEERIRREAAQKEATALALKAEEEAKIAREAEEKAQAAILKANSATNARDRDRALAQADKARQEAEKRQMEADERFTKEQKARDEAEAQRVGQARQFVHIAAPAVQGVSSRKVPKYEVLNIHEVYQHNRTLCKIEASDAAVKAAIKSLAPGESIPGLRVWWETTATVRA